MRESPFTGPFQVRAARRAGVTASALRSSRYVRIGHGLYAPSDADLGLIHRVAAVLLALPRDAVVTGVTALHLHRVEVGDPFPVRAVTASGFRCRRSDVRLIRGSALPQAHGRIAEPVASWLAAVVELGLRDSVVAGDWLVRVRRVEPAAIVHAAELTSGRGCRLARRAASLIRSRVDSPRETHLRLVLVLAGLPEPACNVVLGTEHHPIGRVDLLYEEFKLILEYDGDQHRTDRAQWNNDLDRNDAFTDCGYLTIRVTAARMRWPRAVVRRVHAKLVERGYKGRAPAFGAEWLACFEEGASSGHNW